MILEFVIPFHVVGDNPKQDLKDPSSHQNIKPVSFVTFMPPVLPLKPTGGKNLFF